MRTPLITAVTAAGLSGSRTGGKIGKMKCVNSAIPGPMMMNQETNAAEGFEVSTDCGRYSVGNGDKDLQDPRVRECNLKQPFHRWSGGTLVLFVHLS